MSSFISEISKKEFPLSERISGNSISDSLLLFIRKDHPTFTEKSSIASTELNYFREKYISEYLVKEVGELTKLEKSVLTSMSERSIISDKSENEDDAALTTSQLLADKVASFGGSWTFIMSFGVFILVWISLNVLFLYNKGFDPYPFILLNLILSCVAALQAPIIMMSQNRQEEKDRDRAKKDYMINLKSELEIRILHEKLDHLIMHQQQDLLDIQQVQIEMMKDIIQRIEKKQ